MKSVMITLFLGLSLMAQSSVPLQPDNPFPNQFVGAFVGYSQAAQPQQIFGGVAYAKLLSAAAGTYSYTSIVDTSVRLKPQFTVQTQTQTGACVYTLSLAGFNVYSCAQAGIAVAGSTSGIGASGTVVAMKPVGKKGWQVALMGGPSYSGAVGAVSYPIGVIVGWGK